MIDARLMMGARFVDGGFDREHAGGPFDTQRAFRQASRDTERRVRGNPR